MDAIIGNIETICFGFPFLHGITMNCRVPTGRLARSSENFRPNFLCILLL